MTPLPLARLRHSTQPLHTPARWGEFDSHEGYQSSESERDFMIKQFSSVMMAGLLMAGASAQTTSTGTGGSPAANVAMEAVGKVDDYTPDSALVLDTGSGEPVHYKFAEKVTYVDVDGRDVQASGLRKNVRVRVHYLRENGDLVVNKVTLME